MVSYKPRGARQQTFTWAAATAACEDHTWAVATAAREDHERYPRI